MSINTLEYIQRFLKIRTKSAEIIPFKLNNPQLRLYDALASQYSQGKPMRAIVLKARQMGFSTLTEAIIFKRTATSKNVRSGIVCHTEPAASNLFAMFKLYYEGLPECLKPKKRASNAREVIFDDGTGNGLRSQIKCMTALGKGVGRSDTIQNLHISEYAFWPGDKAKTLSGLLQTVPHAKNTLIVIESTPNGCDHFKQLWDSAVKGESDFIPVFCGWNELDEYSMEYTGFKYTSEEEQLAKKYSLTPEQLTWRRWCIANNCNGDEKVFRQEYPICAQEAFSGSGDCIFNLMQLTSRLECAPEPIMTGMFKYTYDGLKITSFEFIKDPYGCIKIYIPPQTRRPYVIGGDTAGEGSDSFAAQVIDNITGQQAAVMRHGYDESLYARQLYCLGLYYNTALISIEVNFSTYPIKELERLNYPKQFIRQTEDSFTHAVTKSYGFRTTAITRPVIISGLQDAIRNNAEVLNDRDTLMELTQFVRTPSGRAQAAPGSHDDCVMSLAIAYYSRSQQAYQLLEPEVHLKWTQDMLDDYSSADEKTRKEITSLWGSPP